MAARLEHWTRAGSRVWSYEADIGHGHGQGFGQILGMGMAGARIAGGDFFPAHQLAAGAFLPSCQWAEPSLVHPTPLALLLFASLLCLIRVFDCSTSRIW